jgi:hypothetical protein
MPQLSFSRTLRNVGIPSTVDQNKRDPTGFRAAIDPTMVGSALDTDIAWKERRLAIVNQQGNLTVQDDSVINSLRSSIPILVENQPYLTQKLKTRCGGPSSMMTARPEASCPVTTRRIGR